MRKPVLVSVILLLLALSLFMFGNQAQADPGYNSMSSGGSNVIRQIILPDSPVSPSFRLANLLGFFFLAGSVTILAADRHSRKREYF